jgi:hypothetical protein
VCVLVTFGDWELASDILAMKDPTEMKRRGKEVDGFVQDIWDVPSQYIMMLANWEKVRGWAGRGCMRMHFSTNKTLISVCRYCAHTALRWSSVIRRTRVGALRWAWTIRADSIGKQKWRRARTHTHTHTRVQQFLAWGKLARRDVDIHPSIHLVVSRLCA